MDCRLLDFVLLPLLPSLQPVLLRIGPPVALLGEQNHDFRADSVS
jgi:hypothetical protein